MDLGRIEQPRRSRRTLAAAACGVVVMAVGGCASTSRPTAAIEAANAGSVRNSCVLIEDGILEHQQGLLKTARARLVDVPDPNDPSVRSLNTVLRTTTSWKALRQDVVPWCGRF